MGTIADKLSHLAETKSQIKAAIEAKGVEIPEGTSFREYAPLIGDIPTGGELNIAFGDTAPEDTSKLWVKTDSKNDISIFSSNEFAEEECPALPFKAEGIAAAAVESKIYLFGGRDYADGNYVYYDTIQVFDTETNTLTTLDATLPEGTYGISCAAVGSKIYLIGGRIADSTSGSTKELELKSIQVFDTETNTLTMLDVTLSTYNSFTPVAAVGSLIYIFSDFLQEIYMFDTETNHESYIGKGYSNYEHISNAHKCGCVSVGHKIFMFGGTTNGTNRWYEIWIYNTVESKLYVSPLQLPNSTASLGAAAVGSKIYLLGGQVNKGYSYTTADTILVYDIAAETLTTLDATLPKKVEGAACAAVGSKIYLFGGYQEYNGRQDIIQVIDTHQFLYADQLRLCTDVPKGVFTLVNSAPIKLRSGVGSVYVGSETGTPVEVEAYLNKDGAWTAI